MSDRYTHDDVKALREVVREQLISDFKEHHEDWVEIFLKEEMVITGINCEACAESKGSALEMISETFKAMISAAPNPFQTPEESREKK